MSQWYVLEEQGLTLTVVCWLLAYRNNTLASRNLEQLAILARRKFLKKIDLNNFELLAYLIKWTSNT